MGFEEMNLLSLIDFGMSSLSNLWPNKEMLRINQPFGVQSELINWVEHISRFHFFFVLFFFYCNEKERKKRNGLKSKSYMSQWSASTLAESEMNQVEENPRRRGEALKETGNNNKNGYADMKQRTKLDMLCCSVLLFWGSETTSQKVRPGDQKTKTQQQGDVLHFLQRQKHGTHMLQRERKREWPQKKAKPKAQKDILKIYGEKRRIPGKGTWNEPITQALK